MAVGSYYSSATSQTVPLVEFWDGSAWTIQTVSLPSGASGGQLFGVSCPSMTVCTAVGIYYTALGGPSEELALAESWNGTNWSLQPTPNPISNASYSLNAVWCLSAKSCNAVGRIFTGSNEETLAESWDGTTWSIRPTPNPSASTYSYLANLSCDPSGVPCKAVGTSGNETLVESWDGTTWSTQTTPQPANSTLSSFSDVSCTAANACTAVGQYLDGKEGPTGAYRTLAERWDGTQWTAQPTADAALAGTGSATNITSSTAELSGTVYPGDAPTTCYFEYGTTSSYGSTIPCAQSTGPGAASVAVSADLTGLSPNTTYYFTLVATNPAGGMTYTPGPASFTTLATSGGGDGGGAGGGGGGGGAGLPPKPCVSGPGNPPPRVVVVMVMGLNSELPAPSPDPYDPLAEPACNANSSPNAAIRQLGETFDTRGVGSGSGPTLLTSLAQTGALVLPFSYRGAYIVQTSAGPRFFINSYDKSAPNQADIIAEDWTLDNELASIRSTWPKAHIVLIGHSEGGLIIKQWWRNWDGRHGTPDHATRAWNVDGVYSLDGPINGGSNPFQALEFIFPSNTCFVGPGVNQLPCSLLAQQFSALWYDYALGGDDTAMALGDVGDRGVFTPIGTRGDLVMELLSMSGKLINVDGEELGPQLLAAFDSDGQINTLISPGRITPTLASASEGLDSHGVVYRDPSNIAYLTNAVSQAATNNTATAARLRFAATSRLSAGSLQAGIVSTPLVGASPPPAASASLAAPVSVSADTVTIRGTGLGPVAGQVVLVSSSVEPTLLTVRSWSSDRLTAFAPHGPARGAVFVQTETGETIPAGLLNVTGEPSVVHRLRILRSRGRTTDGGLLALTVIATDVRGRPLSGTRVELSDGVLSTAKLSDRRGRAEFFVDGYGPTTYVAMAGTAWRSMLVRWQLPSPVRVRIRHTLRRRGRLRSLVLSVSVRTSRGRPVRGMPVSLTLIRPQHPTPTAITHRTSAAGTVSLSLPATHGGMLTVITTTNYGASQTETVFHNV